MVHSNWKCPKCGLPDISGDRITCPRCGKKRNRWGYWDCRYCGSKGIRGDQKECRQCGHARDRDVKFYLRDDLIEFVDEVSGEDAVRIGHSNWICPYCSQQNDDSVQTCIYCCAARSESTERYHDVQQPQQAPTPESTFAPQPKKKKRGCLKLLLSQYGCCAIMIVLALIAVGIGFIINSLDESGSKKLRHADLSETSWQCNVYIEELKTFQDSDWTLPAGARLLRSQIEDYEYIDHYERRSRQVWVEDYDNNNNDGWDWDDGGGWDDGGWDDFGNGQFGMLRLCTVQPAAIMFRYETEWYDEPVYMTKPREKYYYEYDKWVDVRTVTTSGTGDEEPYFGETDLAENERERTRIITYYVTFYDNNESHRLECTKEQWDRIRESGNVTFRILNPLTYPDYVLADENDEE